ncbi:MAG TPA: DUF4124 domain-containing protein [Gammaproteobacteria bacterium]
MTRNAFFIALALLVPPAIAGTYKWVDKDGTVHYSDTPVKGAEEVDLPEPMMFDAPEVEPPAMTAETEAREEPFAYAAFAFISPKQDQVFWNTAGTIPVQLDLEPRLRPGHTVQLYLNGEPVAMSGLGTTLTGVHRGSWNVRAAVVDQDGKEIATAGPVTFHVKQHSIANPR